MAGRMTGLDNPMRRIRKSRGKGLRTKTGCLTCRKRHKKCDERRPICGPCSLSSRACLYAAVESRLIETLEGDAAPCSPSQSTMRRGVSAAVSTLDRSPSQEATLTLTSLSQTHAFPVPSGPGEPGSFASNPDVQVAQGIEGLSGRNPDAYSYSPDTINSEFLTADLASNRWLDLLATDAAEADKEFSLAPTRNTSPVTDENGAESVSQTLQTYAPQIQATPIQAVGTASSSEAVHDGTGIAAEQYNWQLDQDISIRDHEAELFRTFAERAALWLDLFDPHKHFSTHATRLALRNLGLMKAILAVSSRYVMAKTPSEEADTSEPVQYYYETLQYVQEALQYASYTRSEELLATTIIISTYEMLDDSNSNWKRHLKGVFWIQRSQNVHGASGGLRQSVWWAWLRQDIWAAFREKRPCFSFWKPVKDIFDLTQDDLADRAVYLLSQAVNYCANTQASVSTSIEDRVESGEVLLSALERWRSSLGPGYKPLPSPRLCSSVFKPIWIHPPHFSVAMQVYHFARILITLHRPSVAGFRGYLQTQQVLSEAVDAICGIAMELKDEGSQILSAQCLFGAGLCTQDPVKRDKIISLINACEARTEWPMSTLTTDLSAEWAKFK